MNNTEIPSYAVHTDTTISGFFGPYRFLSNFPEAPVEFLGVRYGSTEVAFQSAKAKTPEAKAKFVNFTSSEAKAAGNALKPYPELWEEQRVDIMTYLVFQKFSRHADLREKLLATGSRTLIEANHWRDSFWGVWYRMGSNAMYELVGGENWLGNILMQVRGALK